MPDATILIVEDNPQLQDLLIRYFEMEGYHIVSTNFETLDAVRGSIQNHKPRLLILDGNIHPVPSIDILSAVRNDPGLADLPVVVISGIDNPEAWLAAGANRFILKPFMPHDLVSAVNQQLAAI